MLKASKRSLLSALLLGLVMVLASCSTSAAPTELETQGTTKTETPQIATITFETGKFAGQTLTGRWDAETITTTWRGEVNFEQLTGVAEFPGLEEGLQINVTTQSRGDVLADLRLKNESNDARACGRTYCWPAPQLGDTFAESPFRNAVTPIPFRGKIERESASGTFTFTPAD